MVRYKQESGNKYFEITVIGEYPEYREGSQKTYWLCRCSCGKEWYVSGDNLRLGRVKSCGHLNRKLYGIVNEKRPEGYHYTKKSWLNLLDRCLNPKSVKYPSYGGRGIKVCSRWLESFENFLQDVGYRPAGKSIGRIDVNGNYEPSNCRWESYEEQALNRRNTVYVEGVPLVTFCKLRGINPNNFRIRLSQGWSIEEALTIPIRKKKPNRIF